MGSAHTHEAPIKNTFLGRLDARAKILAIIPAVVLVNVLDLGHWRQVAAVALPFAALYVLAGREALAVLKRGVYLVPFVLFVVVTLPFAAAGNEAFALNLGITRLVATDEGLARAASVAAGALTSIAGVLLLSGSTEGPDLFHGLRQLGVPKAFVAVMGTVYRYLFEMASDLSRIRRAAAARGFEARSLASASRIGSMAGAVLVRSVVRSENVHNAMLARGFDGEVRTVSRGRFGWREAAFLAAFWATVAIGIGLAAYA
jgi:cobalt/nickel transport system permease protein